MSAFDPMRVFRKLAYNNALANTRLHRVCATLQPGEFEAGRVSFFPSIKSTLNHILTVDWFYVDALEGGTLGLKAFEVEEPFDTLDALSVEQSKVDWRLVILCENLNPEALVRVIDLHRGNRIQRERAEDVLSHLFQHQTIVGRYMQCSLAAALHRRSWTNSSLPTMPGSEARNWRRLAGMRRC